MKGWEEERERQVDMKQMKRCKNQRTKERWKRQKERNGKWENERNVVSA